MTLDAIANSRVHSHRFDSGNPLAERNTRRAMWLKLSVLQRLLLELQSTGVS